MRRRLLSVLFTSSFIAGGMLLGARSAAAATFTVDTQDDGTDDVSGDGQCATTDGRCTLRAAIEEANALPGPDTVILPAGTYLIAREGDDEDHCESGDLDITSAISIRGDGARTTIVDANHRDRAFDVHETGAAVISGVTIRNGSAEDGGGIRIDGGTLKIVESTVTQNQAAGSGGGIECDLGVLEVVECTISGNVAHDSGGGLDNDGTATLRNVTVSGNTADSSGGGISNFGTVTLNNCTITANTLDGVDNEGQLVSSNTVLADNADGDCVGDFTSRGFNLIHDPTECTFDGDTSGDLLDKPANLGPLQDNGGPTMTHALLSGSAALDAGNPAAPGNGDPTCEATDQRGVGRPQGPRCDIGAYEACSMNGSPDGAHVGACSASCGNGVVEMGEECDDGASNGMPGNRCDADCRRVDDGGSAGGGFVCGNGVKDPGEECDDGNTNDDDGCDEDCDLEDPLTCDDGACDRNDCDASQRFEALNCVLQTPMCEGESLPISILKRLAKARDTLALAKQSENTRRAKKLVGKAGRMLGKCDKIRNGFLHKGKLSDECAAALHDVLSRARSQCKNWRHSM